MSDLIKTGTQICQSHAWSEQFVSLSWLKQKIKETKEEETDGSLNEEFVTGFDSCCDWVLSLLEEKP